MGISRRSMLRGGAGALALTAAGGWITSRASLGTARADTTTAATGPQMTVTTNESGIYEADIFFTYTGGLELADVTGTPVWGVAGTDTYTNFQQQTYQDDKVFTWWQGTGGPGAGGTGQGTDMITTPDQKPVTTIGESADGFFPDTHEFLITPTNTALITSYAVEAADLSAVGGPANGKVRNAYWEEIDIATGTVLHRWSALEHIPLSDSYAAVPTSATSAYDYFHMNSISITPDNQILISSRHTCTLYKIDWSSGEVIWKLGGKSSDFAVDSDAVFGFQHHAAFENDTTIKLFDDGSMGSITWHPSRAAWISVDTSAMRASLADSMTIPGIQSTSQGSAQRLPNSNVFVSWGSVPRLTEFSPKGDVLFDATLPSASYRGFKFQVG